MIKRLCTEISHHLKLNVLETPDLILVLSIHYRTKEKIDISGCVGEEKFRRGNNFNNSV